MVSTGGASCSTVGEEGVSVATRDVSVGVSRGGVPERGDDAGEDRGLRDRFDDLAAKATTILGSMWAMLGSVTLVVVWVLSGPIFGFSETWQLIINTTTTVITFWMVFVIQNSSNRQDKATQLKLDEIIRVLADARDELIGVDHASEDDLEAKEAEFAGLAAADKAPDPSRPR
jgi:low affinity Fe/Cu permease